MSIDELFVQTPAAEAWATLTTQPLSALTRPADPVEAYVPLVEMGPCEALDIIVSRLAATGDEISGPVASRKRKIV